MYKPLVSLTLCLSLSSCMFSSKMQKELYGQVEKKQFDVIIVPGIQFEHGVWGRIMKGRVYWSKYLYDKGIAKNIIYSGGAVYTPYYESKIMALYGQALGIPLSHIYLETKAEHSTENIYYSYKLARKLGFNSYALVTDPFQSRQLRKFIRKKIADSIALIPFVVDTLKAIEPQMTDPPIDYGQAFKKDFIPITRRERFWKRWRGTRGHNIDEKAYN